MDDSERSYGYSRDIYHGRRGVGGQYGQEEGGGQDSPRFYPERSRRERSYEYGPEWSLDEYEAGELSPEESAMRVTGGGGVTPRPERGGGGSYDYDRGGSYNRVESFTWDIPGPHSGRGPRGYKRADPRIHEDICDRLEAHGAVDASDIEVKVENGEVTLTGTVPDRRMKRLAEDVAECVRGVADVHNQLRLGRREGEGR